MPNLQIIDYGFGFTGSTHDATAWEHTQIYKKRNELLNTNKFVWADSAYPMRTFLKILPKRLNQISTDRQLGYRPIQTT